MRLYTHRGFTLIELIVVIALSSIVAVISVTFIRQTIQGSIDTAARQRLAAAGAIINEQISRVLRSALPGSIRTTSDNRCIEYMPVIAASSYISLVIGTPIAQMQVVPYSSSAAATGFLSIYPFASGNIYDQSDPGALTDFTITIPAASTAQTINFGTTHTFTTESPLRRFYISTAPISICQQGNFLYRYEGYGFVDNVANLVASLPSTQASGREVLGAFIADNSMRFRFTPPTLQRNGVVTFDYTLQDSAGDDELEQSQEVQIRNVP